MLLTDRRSVAANSTEANVLAGKTQEFCSVPSLIRFGNTAAAVGLFVTIIVGNEVIVDDQEASAQNRLPIDPDDYWAEAGAKAGDRIVVKLRNSTGAAIIGFTGVKITPLA